MAAFETTKDNFETACCAQFYELEWVQNLLGESFHPGGMELTARLVRSLHLPPNTVVLDIACGIGSTTRWMAREFNVEAIGLDASEKNVFKAQNSTTTETNVNATFIAGNAESLPFPDNSLHAVICECALSTFTDQTQVVAEMARVLKPGGVIGISDMILESPLSADLLNAAAPWTCLTHARSVVELQQLFLAAGLRVVEYVDESAALTEFIVTLKRKLLAAGLGQAIGAFPGGSNLAISEMRDLLRRASEEVKAGVVQYARLTFAKGRPEFAPREQCKAPTEIRSQSTACDPATGCCSPE